MRSKEKGRGRRVILIALAAAAGVAGVLLALQASSPASSGQPAASEERSAPESAGGAGVAVGAGERGPGVSTRVAPASAQEPGAAAGADPELSRKRLARAEQALRSYREATRYSPESRPISEHPDQIYPHPTAERSPPLQRGSDTRVRLQQDRVFLMGEDAARLSVGCHTSSGAPVRCQILAAVANEASDSPAAGQLVSMPVRFADDGQNGDQLAGDGVYTARFQPSAQGFALYHGGIRVDLRLRDGDEEGMAFFDLYYNPAAPATFTGAIREVVENGSLSLYLRANVRHAGRYVVAARADDANDKPFAYLSFNDELREGKQEVRLVVFGKLIRDQSPPMPLKLRDVEGFLLLEDAFPDRELMPMLAGYVHTTQHYAPGAFSDAEWQSEERDRNLQQLQRDVDEAQKQLEGTPAPDPGK